VFVGNQLTAQQLTAAYAARDPIRYYEEISIPTRAKIALALKNLSPLFRQGVAPRSVLEVGCGDGAFLEALQEIHPEVCTYGHELPGPLSSLWTAKRLRVFTGALEEIRDTFGVVVLLDVAEHVPDPNRTFSACRALLDGNGHLYLHTPRLCLWDRLFLAARGVPGLGRFCKAWLRARVSIYHLQLWTDRALAVSLARAGLEVVYIRRQTELSWPLERYLRMYLTDRFPRAALLASPLAALAGFVFVRLGTLRNKAVCLARAAPCPEARHAS